MSFVERRDVYRPAAGEAPFLHDEIFFSRTDTRGVIIAGNYVFSRVSNYYFEELIGAPHKIVRHPDMPKGLFYLMWNQLERGQAIGAYVNNKAKDGLNYWVYAVALPYREGYISVRIKPTSKFLDAIKLIYSKARKAETEDGISPKESADLILKEIEGLGFPDYQIFSGVALTTELQARKINSGITSASEIEALGELIVAADELQKETVTLSEEFSVIGSVSNNMRVVASRLEPSGGAISTLSQNYWSMSEEMSTWFQEFVFGKESEFMKIRNTLVECQFLICTSQILNEAATQFDRERRQLGTFDIDAEKSQMNDLALHYKKESARQMAKIADDTQKITKAISVMRRYALGLSSTRVMCNIESVRVPSGMKHLNSITRQLESFQKTVEKHLMRVEDLSCQIQIKIEMMT